MSKKKTDTMLILLRALRSTCKVYRTKQLGYAAYVLFVILGCCIVEIDGKSRLQKYVEEILAQSKKKAKRRVVK